MFLREFAMFLFFSLYFFLFFSFSFNCFLTSVLSCSMHTDMKCNDVVPWVLNSILSKSVGSANPHVRQAACIWLLSLVRKLSQHKEIKVCLIRNTAHFIVFIVP